MLWAGPGISTMTINQAARSRLGFNRMNEEGGNEIDIKSREEERETNRTNEWKKNFRLSLGAPIA